MDAQAIISNIVEVLKQVDGMQALVLGGSRAKGTHHPGSDIDIGIYYNPAPFVQIGKESELIRDVRYVPA
ncbi:nucleotidyltransferase domain-containing protein [Paenibacillus sp. FSL W8-0194]|uniref:nucleotidyltransferase domain-containing protein n=1 Tax=Paenibacillus sp. FSL W8-0194 TaxID=2921711 RepID=UPI0030D7A8A5